MTTMNRVFILLTTIFLVAIIYLWGHSDGRAGKSFGFTEVAFAAESSPGVSPVEARPRDVYYPNSERLAKDEMRVIACGTGMPTTRAAQAAACFLVELGNGDKRRPYSQHLRVCLFQMAWSNIQTRLHASPESHFRSKPDLIS